MFRISRQSKYPRQFWLLFWGMLISAIGGSMVWPFLTIYLRQRLEVSLTAVTLLLTLNSGMGIAATAFVGPMVDRFGRKTALTVSLLSSALILLGMSVADSFGMWAVLMLLSGCTNPLYRVGSNAMVADLIEPERRVDAYSLLRMVNNLGVAIGPAVGGYVAGVSYSLAFLAGAIGDLVFGLLVLILARETLPKGETKNEEEERRDMGYGPVLRDRPFLAFCATFVLTAACSSVMMILLPVYANENFGVLESQYGFIMATNAAMVVAFQYLVTRASRRWRPTTTLALGSLVYAVGVGSVALGWRFEMFWASMVVATVGELLAIPTGTTLTANLAPVDMRGRYMGIYGLVWPIAFGVGPVIGGLLNDYVGPIAIWYGGLAMGLAATAGFVILSRRPSFRTLALEGSVD